MFNFPVMTWLLFREVAGLKCWQCIADDCDIPPDTNYKATRITCVDGASCQVMIQTIRRPGSRV